MATYQQYEQEILIRLYGNRMEQAMNNDRRADAVIWMEAMYDAINTRNTALWESVNIKAVK